MWHADAPTSKSLHAPKSEEFYAVLTTPKPGVCSFTGEFVA